MKRYVRKLISETLGNMQENGQIRVLPSFVLDVPKENFGDYSTNVAHNIAREGNFSAPDVAEIIAREIKTLDAEGKLGEVNVVNGFINIFIAEKQIAKNTLLLQKEIDIEQSGNYESGKQRKVVFEYSSPNTNKPLHIGHTRNDVFGMANINLLRACGYNVVAAEIINDRGIHIMKSMLMYMRHGNGETPESSGEKPDHFVGKYYAMFSAESEKSEEAKAALETSAQELLQKWEAGDEDVRTLWKKMNDWFFEGVKVTYKKEGSEFDDVEFESNIYDKGREVVLKGLERGIFQKEEDGSVSVDLSDVNLDKKYLLRKDGTTLYITQDIYLWSLRNQKYSPELAIVTTSAEQAYHFNVLAEIFKRLEFPWADSFKHLPYEHVYLGKSKMSSRAGNAVSADELLRVTKERVQETMRNSQKIKASPDDEETVEAIAFAAIKYGYLKYDRNTKIYFDLEETIAIEGNTGPYLQYTYARINSVLKKSEISNEEILKKAGDLKLLVEPAEISLMRFLMHYGESVVSAANEYRPNTVCNYLFELASKFNVFYNDVSVLGADNEELKLQRLNLLISVATVLQHGLGLLGIKTVEEM
jgi:arginyl-tRNA synthetase